MTDSNPFIRLWPFQLIEADERLYIRRGVLRIALEGAGVADAVAMLQEAATDQFVSRGDLLSLFPPIQRSQVDALLRELVVRQLAQIRGAPPPDTAKPAETQEDVFFWQLGMSRAEARRGTAGAVVVVGLNRLSLSMIDQAKTYGDWTFTLIDDVALRNHRLFEAGGLPAHVAADEASAYVRDALLVIACAEFGGLTLLKPWNALCAEYGTSFLPVRVEELSVKLGPLTLPDQTACLACLEARQNSHLKGRASDERLIDACLTAGQAYSGSSPAAVSVAATLAAFELLRFSAGFYPRGVGKLIDFSLMNSAMVASRVLRVPRCPVCSPMRHAGNLDLVKSAPDPERWNDVEEMGARHGRH